MKKVIDKLKREGLTKQDKLESIVVLLLLIVVLSEVSTKTEIIRDIQSEVRGEGITTAVKIKEDTEYYKEGMYIVYETEEEGYKLGQYIGVEKDRIKLIEGEVYVNGFNAETTPEEEGGMSRRIHTIEEDPEEVEYIQVPEGKIYIYDIERAENIEIEEENLIGELLN